MNGKITFAILVVALLCLTSSTEGNKFRDALKRIGKAAEKVGKKALDDGLVTAYLGSKIGKRSVDSVLEEDHSPEEGLWLNEPTVLLNRPEADEVNKKIHSVIY